MQKQIAIVVSLLAGASLAIPQPALWEIKRDGERLETVTVAGVPYSATALTTSTQTLADGTKITSTITALLARDSSGRTRREQSMNAIGPWSTDANEHIIYVRDPIAQKSYIVQPAEQRVIVAPLNAGPTFREDLKAKMAAEKAHLRLKTQGMTKESVDAQPLAIITLDQPYTSHSEDLGEEVIEGVRAKGKRETQNIPVGKIGNDRPIQVVSESWYSDDLQAIVLSKHSDPRAGDTEYRLTGISRTEPAKTLFDVPAGYAIIERGKPE